MNLNPCIIPSIFENNLQLNFRENFAKSFSNYLLVNTEDQFFTILDIFKCLFGKILPKVIYNITRSCVTKYYVHTAHCGGSHD